MKTANSENTHAARCGLYCGACIDNLIHKTCHGCNCECQQCASSAHHKNCNIFQCCVEQQQLSNCSECTEFPCTRLIQFCYNPVWQHHYPIIENLKRRKAIGTTKWLKDQKTFWQKYPWYLNAWLWLQKECEERLARLKEAPIK